MSQEEPPDKARSLAPLNGWACAVKICHDGMLKDTNSLDGDPMICGVKLPLLSINYFQSAFSGWWEHLRNYEIPSDSTSVLNKQKMIIESNWCQKTAILRCIWWCMCQFLYWSAFRTLVQFDQHANIALFRCHGATLIVDMVNSQLFLKGEFSKRVNICRKFESFIWCTVRVKSLLSVWHVNYLT